MKIINRLEFLKLPSGTVYCKYTPQIFGDLHVKACNPSDGWDNDWLYIPLTGAFDIEGCDNSDHYHDILVSAEDIGLEFKADYEVSGRDGLYEEDQLFCVYDKNDIISLINKLQTIIQMIKIPELDIEVEDISEFNDRASEILEEFCMELDKQPGMSRPSDPEVDSFLYETNFTHIWSREATKLIEAEQTRLYHIGEKYFGRPNLDLDIETSWFREP